MKSLLQQMRDFPKTDLHRHLEGSISPETLLKVAQEYGGCLPTRNLADLRIMVQTDNDPPSFESFLNKFKIFRGVYPNREAIEYIAYTAVKEAAEDNVKYLELRYSPTHFACSGRFNERDVIDWVQGSIQQASKAYDIIVTPILTISRDFGVELAQKTVDMILYLPSGYFSGLDIAGNETEKSAKPFSNLFKKAKDNGLSITIHAGEAGSAENINEAVTEFQADRIGHGTKSINEDKTIDLLIKNNILLEVCLTSNLHTGTVTSISKHPAKLFKEKGVLFSLNTDDPAISNITLSDEYVLAVDKLGFTEQDLKSLNLTALDHSFFPDKQALRQKIAHFWQ